MTSGTIHEVVCPHCGSGLLLQYEAQVGAEVRNMIKVIDTKSIEQAEAEVVMAAHAAAEAAVEKARTLSEKFLSKTTEPTAPAAAPEEATSNA